MIPQHFNFFLIKIIKFFEVNNLIEADFHVHTEFSNDCSIKAEKQIESAIKLGFKHVCITDHCDMHLYNDEKYVLDINSYLNKINILKEKYKKQINVFCGIEIGLLPNLKEDIHKSINSSDYDFIIGSSHAVNGLDIGYNAKKYFNEKSEKEAYFEYFESILKNVNVFNNYDVYGHLDYIVRYGPNKDKNFDFNDYKDVFGEILKNIIKNNKGIEINTSALRNNLKYPHPHKDILKMYKELGGEIITVGSDAHLPEHIGYGFRNIPELLKSVGFKQYTVFENHIPRFINL